DLFSLGVTLYTAVEGRPPFDKGDPFETMRAVVEEPPAPFARAGALSTVLAGLLEKDPAMRWDVPHTRAVLRELIDGPLAATPSPHPETDPFAVIRTPAPPPRYPQSRRRIGGRALLGPGDPIGQRALPGPREQADPRDQDAYPGAHTGSHAGAQA